MSAFKKLGPDDQLDNVLILEPSYALVSGTSGWRGGPDGSASVDLWGDSRKTVVKSAVYESRYQTSQTQFGRVQINNPITASVRFVYMTDTVLGLGQTTSDRWGRDHWRPVMGLYDYYKAQDPDYVTASYDYYCLYFNSASQNVVQVYDWYTDVGGGLRSSAAPTGSFSLEAWVKPFATGSSSQFYTILAHSCSFRFGIDGSTGRLSFTALSGSSTVGTATSSLGVTSNVWHHTAVTFDSTSLSGNLWIDLTNVGSFTLPYAIPPAVSFTGSLTIGARWGGGVSSGIESAGVAPGGIALDRTQFHGFIAETRVWNTSRTWAQLSSSFNRRLAALELTGGLVSYVKMNEGPLAYGSPVTDPSAVVPSYGGGLIGSGVIDWSARARRNTMDFGNLWSFDGRVGPVWHPNDNVRFYPDKSLAPTVASGAFWSARRSADLARMLVVDVPSAFYGRQITPGSVVMVCDGFSSSGYGLVRTLVDDGRGNLYLSGSACSSSFDLTTGSFVRLPEDYAGVGWNKVGNVFYSEGIVTIKDPSLLDFGTTNGSSADATNAFQLSFRGQSRIPVKTISCPVDPGEFNCSLNQTFYVTGSDGVRTRRHPSGSLRFTAVGIYDKNYDLVGVAKLAEPIRNRDRDQITVRLRLDF